MVTENCILSDLMYEMKRCRRPLNVGNTIDNSWGERSSSLPAGSREPQHWPVQHGGAAALTLTPKQAVLYRRVTWTPGKVVNWFLKIFWKKVISTTPLFNLFLSLLSFTLISAYLTNILSQSDTMMDLISYSSSSIFHFTIFTKSNLASSVVFHMTSSCKPKDCLVTVSLWLQCKR